MIIYIRDKVHAGDRVSDMTDLRHVGVVRAIVRGICEIKWDDDSGFISHLHRSRLTVVGEPVATPAKTAPALIDGDELRDHYRDKW
jgi:hypothetical protein